MKYDELKKSPLSKKDVEPEEVIIWFDVQNMASAKKINEMLQCIEYHYHSGASDFYEKVNINSPVSFQTIFKNVDAGYVSDTILKNLFTALFKYDLLDVAEMQKLLSKVTKSKNKLHKKSSNYKTIYFIRQRYVDLLEVFSELEERLKEKCDDYAKLKA